MNRTVLALGLTALSLAAAAPRAAAQTAQPDVTAALRWRNIGPHRGGRGRSAVGTPGTATRPTALYVGFDNGGLWRTTDYGANWVPLFDEQPTGSIGAIGIAESNPDIIYVGTGAGIIRPDLATGDGMYKSTDAGRTWTHLGLRESQMIAQVDVDPTNPERLFVAVLGHPYGPNAERGVFRSTDGGRTFERVLYRDEYTSANDVIIDPRNPNIVYAALWPQQQAFWEGGDFTSGTGGVYKSTDGGTTWMQLTQGLPPVLEANLAISPSNPQVLYAMVAATSPTGAGSGPVGFYKSTDGGATWTMRTRSVAAQGEAGTLDRRALGRIGGGDLPPIVVDPLNENVVYSASIVMWRTEDAGATWSAVRGAPGGDDYQRIWIHPTDPNVILAIADQGAVVSANRGVSWSGWYNQSTAAMYHTTADNAYPYRVCSGQQDAGSACVASRSMDGRITFHDWHPANIQEYGMGASDPRDPDIVFGSARTNVSRYDRRTGQTTLVGPDAADRGQLYGRNVRTMPLVWSPANPDVLYYASNVVWRSLDRARTWTRISPDLARQTWTPPPSAGRYAAGITPTPRGAITALAPSPRSAPVLWAGTDDGLVQVTTNGGLSWRDVTPSGIQPWTRIFNLEAGHFDAQTAYLAANTLRIDDMRPHFWRTHDGGATWTEISAGIGPSVANAIREDPRRPGLLYAATDTQVWVSFDDGDSWQSLRINMPAISVRDIQVKDDSLCGCADLIAGTHGRGFWILDDLTPLRQAAAVRAAQASGTPYLARPLVATRVRFGTNEPTPWPPELPAGENPPDGAVLDYFLPADAAGRVTLEIVDGAGRVVRRYASDDPVLEPDPALDPVAYDQVCRRNPNATHCGLPLYWPAPQERLSARAGMHRALWDMRMQPLTTVNPAEAGTVTATGAVPGRSVLNPRAPWAAPGRYTVRLTVNGTAYTQPLTLRLDPRVRTPAAGLLQLATLTREMYDRARDTRAAWEEARTLRASLAQAGGAEPGMLALLDSLAPAPRPGGGGPGFGGGGAGAAAPPTLESASNALLAAAMAMQNADVAPTAAQVAACARARTQAVQVMARWTRVRGM